MSILWTSYHRKRATDLYKTCQGRVRSMLITSSRKPSNRTRTLCKYLATFFNCEYVNRGKMGMGEVLHLAHDDPLLIVGEFHGNPGSLAIYDSNGLCLLSIHMTVSYPENSKFSKLKLVEPVIVGTGRSELNLKLADALASSLSLQRTNDTSDPRYAMVYDDGGMIDFIDFGNVLFKIKVKSLKLDFSE